MAEDRKNAIDNARNAMAGTGIVLYLTSTQAANLRTSSNSVAKESKKLEKTISKIVKKFKVYDSIIRDIKKTLKTSADDATKVSRVSTLLSSNGDAYKLEEAAQEERPSIAGTTKDTMNAVQKAVPGVAAFALALPLLFSPEVRDMLFGFFNGFLEGLGLSNEALTILKPVLGAAIGILGAVFTINALSPVITLFGHMQKLVSVIGLAAQAVVAKSEMADVQISDLRSKRLKMAKRLRTLKGIKSFLMNIGKLLKTSVVAAAAGVAIDVVGGTILDVVTADPDTEISATNIVKMAVNNLVESVTFGMMKGPYDLDKKDPEELQQEIDKKKETYSKDITPASSPASSTKSQTQPVTKALATSTTAQDAKAATESATSTSKTTATNSTTSAPNTSTTSVPSKEEKTTVTDTPPTSQSGLAIKGLSASINAVEVDIKKSLGNSLISINNSKTILASEDGDQQIYVPTYSTSVGK